MYLVAHSSTSRTPAPTTQVEDPRLQAHWPPLTCHEATADKLRFEGRSQFPTPEGKSIPHPKGDEVFLFVLRQPLKVSRRTNAFSASLDFVSGKRNIGRWTVIQKRRWVWGLLQTGRNPEDCRGPGSAPSPCPATAKAQKEGEGRRHCWASG